MRRGNYFRNQEHTFCKLTCVVVKVLESMMFHHCLDNATLFGCLGGQDQYTFTRFMISVLILARLLPKDLAFSLDVLAA